MIFTRKKIAAQISIGGKVIPISQYSLSITKNAIPQLTASLVRGKLVIGEKHTGSNNPVQGKSCQLKLYLGEESAIVFKGYLKSSTVSVKNDPNGGQYIHNIVAEHEIGKLGGLAIKNRVFAGKDETPSHLDMFVEDYKDATRNIESVTVNELVGKSLPKELIKVFKQLHEAEKQDNVRAADKDAITMLNKIKVVGCHFDPPVENTKLGTLRPALYRGFINNIIKSWGNSNTLTLLLKNLAELYCMLRLNTNSGDLEIVADCSLVKTPNATIHAKAILAISSSTSYAAVPVEGIRLRLAQSDTGRTAKGKDIYAYPQEVKGEDKSILYQYMDAPSWVSLFGLSDSQIVNEQHKSLTRSKNSPTGKKVTVTQGKKAIADEDDSLYDLIAKTLLGMLKWRRSSVTLSIIPTFKINVGDVVKINVDASKMNKSLKDSVYYGQVASINYTGSAGNIHQNLQVIGVRNEASNSSDGFNRHPIYKD